MISDLIYKQAYYSPDECNKIIEEFKDKEFTRSRAFFSALNDVVVQRFICLEHTINRETASDSTKELLARVDEDMKNANDSVFGFDVPFNEVEVKLMKFLGEEKAFLTKHQKVNWITTRPTQRKLFASVNLTDPSTYEGSEYLLHNFYSNPPSFYAMKAQGALVMFPSFKGTELTPVLTGTKYMLFFDYYGPYWK